MLLEYEFCNKNVQVLRSAVNVCNENLLRIKVNANVVSRSMLMIRSTCVTMYDVLSDKPLCNQDEVKTICCCVASVL